MSELTCLLSCVCCEFDLLDVGKTWNVCLRSFVRVVEDEWR